MFWVSILSGFLKFIHVIWWVGCMGVMSSIHGVFHPNGWQFMVFLVFLIIFITCLECHLVAFSPTKIQCLWHECGSLWNIKIHRKCVFYTAKKNLHPHLSHFSWFVHIATKYNYIMFVGIQRISIKWVHGSYIRVLVAHPNHAIVLCQHWSTMPQSLHCICPLILAYKKFAKGPL